MNKKELLEYQRYLKIQLDVVTPPTKPNISEYTDKPEQYYADCLEYDKQKEVYKYNKYRYEAYQARIGELHYKILSSIDLSDRKEMSTLIVDLLSEYANNQEKYEFLAEILDRLF